MRKLFVALFLLLFTPAFAWGETYTKLEYIQSTGSQWLDTKFAPTPKTKAEIGVITTNNISNTLMGYCNNDFNGDSWRLFNASGYLYFDFAGTSSRLRLQGGSGSFPYGQYADIAVGNNYAKNKTKNITLRGGYQTVLHNPTRNILLFRDVCHSANSSAKVYYLRIYDDDIVVRSLIPARRDSDNVVGLYDVVNKVFYTNSGSGTFGAGAAGDKITDDYPPCPNGYHPTTTDGSPFKCVITCPAGTRITTPESTTCTTTSGPWFTTQHDVVYDYISSVNYCMAPYTSTSTNSTDHDEPSDCSKEISGKSVSGDAVSARYIRVTTTGSTANVYSHIVEIEAFESHDGTGTNLLSGKPGVSGGNMGAGTDGIWAREPSYASGNMVWDLGQVYSLGSIKFSLYTDGRIYHDVTVYTSTDNASWTTVLGPMEIQTQDSFIAIPETIRLSGAPTDCIPGTYSESFTATYGSQHSCSVCPAHTYISTHGATECISCTDMSAGTGTTPQDHDSMLDCGFQCPAGKYLAEYQKLEYIESTGTQWIDTQIIPTLSNDFVIRIDMEFSSLGIRNFIIGTYAGSDPCLNIELDTTNKIRLYNTSGTYEKTGTTPISQQRASFFITSNNGNITVSGAGNTITIKPTNMNNKSFWLFRDQRGSTPFGNQKLYGLTIAQTPNIVRNLIPVRRSSDEKVGLLDSIHNVFYTNSGTGDFIAGPAIDGEFCQPCPVGTYKASAGNNSSCTTCPTEYTTDDIGATNLNMCKLNCLGGTYVATANGLCEPVGPGYWAPYSTTSAGNVGVRNQCPTGLTTIGIGSGADESGDCGRVLHIGNDVLYLRSDKKTTPSLNFDEDKDGTPDFFGNMSTTPYNMSLNSTKSLKISNSTINYCVYDDSLNPSGYIFDSNGRLIGADSKIYLQSSGTQHIDTGFKPNQDTKLEIRFKLMSAVSSSDLPLGVFPFGSRVNWRTNGFEWLGPVNSATELHFVYGDTPATLSAISIVGKEIDLTANKNTWTSTIDSFTFAYTPFQTVNNLFLFRSNLNNTPHGVGNIREKYVKIYDNGTLIRHFIPVPKGMIIGDYVVPSNGMWDTVEQKFYGNAGTGDFIYGHDE